MKDDKDYLKDIAEIRSMMERSSKFLTLSGWAGVMAGIYALTGAFVVYYFFSFNPGHISGAPYENSLLLNVIATALVVLILAISTAVYLSYNKAQKKEEKLWNATSKRLLNNMAVPLVAGGILILILISKNLNGLIMPLSMIFYGLALYNAGRFTYNEVRFIGLIQIGLGLISVGFVEYSLFIWALGFGLVHIFYGIYIHNKYEK